MGIRVKNLQHKVYEFVCRGNATAANNKDSHVVQFPGYISNCLGVCKDGGASTASVVDINKNGTTIFGGATKVSFSAAAPAVVSYATLTANPTPVAAGDVLSMDVDSCSTTASNLTVLVTVTRTGVVTADNITDHDDVL